MNAPAEKVRLAALAGALAAALAVAAALGGGMIGACAPTYDEPVHLMSGFLALSGYRPPNYRDHPPFGEMWAALPLLYLRPALLTHHGAWGRLYNFADVFLYRNRVDARRLLDAARWWCLLSWTALFAMLILAWSGRLGGPPALAAAALGLAFCPPLFANAALVSTDAAGAFFFLLAFWSLSASPRRTRDWALAGAATGLALASKFSMIALPPIAAAALLAEARARKARLGWGGPALALAAAAAALLAVYRFQPGPFWAGLTETLGRLHQGRAAFLLGRHGTQGWWWYFPAALLVKTPLPLLGAAALGAGVWLRRREPALPWVLLPPAAYFLAACLSKTQIGYRHLLPVYPFLLIAAGCGAAWLWERARWGKLACALAAAWLALGVARAHPHHLAYFNELAGGPAGGWRWLADSNLDWGQGLAPLAAELRRRGNPPIYLSYFGVGDPSYYGIRYAPVGRVSNVERQDGVAAPDPKGPVWLAVSETNLHGVYYPDHEIWAWLKRRRPSFVAGYSIFVYDLSGDPDGRRRLTALLGPAR